MSGSISSVNIPVTETRDNMNIVIVGHVDHGKSTIIGRLLADTGSLPDGKLEFITETCRRNAKPFEYAFILDALKDEQSQGITIDSTRCFFNTAKRSYIIIDAPGHIEFLKNMVTGAARAEAALLVIDASEGVRENSCRHGYMLSMLGIKQIAVLVNKMDLVDYQQSFYEDIKDEYSSFLNEIGIPATVFIPVSGMKGDNIASRSETMPWYQGSCILELVDMFHGEKAPGDKPFRMPVQGVYKFTENGDQRRIIAGNIVSGNLNVGDEVLLYPGGKKSRVQTIEGFNQGKITTIGPGYATGFTLTDQIFVSRGDLVTVAGQHKPSVTSRIRVNLFWLGRTPMKKEREYTLKIGTAKITAYLEDVIQVLDASTLKREQKDQIERHDVAECVIALDRDVAFDLPDIIIQTGRFVIVDNYEISGGGIVQEALEDQHEASRENVQLRNIKWERGLISEDERAERYNQKSTLILITGKKGMNRKEVAKALEKTLFEEGKRVYFFSMGNLLYGLDADLKAASLRNNHKEHFRRFSEVANMMLDAGIILIVSVIEMTSDDIRQLTMGVSHEKILTVWLGEEVTTDVTIHLHIPKHLPIATTVSKVKEFMQKKGIIFRLR